MSEKPPPTSIKTSYSTPKYPVSPHKNSKPTMTKKQPDMEPIESTCKQCGRHFVITRRDQIKKQFCRATCRKSYSRQHAQWLRDRARDDAYAELTMKLWQTQKENRAIKERDKHLTKLNKRYGELLDEIASTMPRLIATGWLSVNRNNPDGWDWDDFLKRSPVNWDILFTASDTFHPLTEQSKKEINNVEDTTTAAAQDEALPNLNGTFDWWDEDDNQQDVPLW